MKQGLKNIFRGPVVFYPLLFAVFPILFLYVHNISETSASQVWLPLIIAVASGLVLWVVLTLMLGSLAKAGFATAIFLVLFFAYGRFYDVLQTWGLSVKHAYLFSTTLFIWGYCVYFISRTERDFSIATRWLNIAAVVLIAMNLFNIVSYQVKLGGVGAGTPSEWPAQPATNATESATLPDIYFIILDEYAHSDTMQEYYNYNNSEFIDGLEEKGFFVAGDSETQIPLTPLIIAQRLNMEYIDGEPWSDVVYQRIGYNKVAEFLKTQSYQYIVFGNDVARYTWEKYSKDYADLYFNHYREAAASPVSDFQKILWNTTMLKPFYYHLLGSRYDIAYRGQVLHTLEHLKALPELRGPKFVFVHFNCPHEPFVFGPEGEYITSENWNNHEDKQFYLGQYRFISREIEKVVDVLLEESESPPIIILQSDHGTRSNYPVGGDAWHRILNAMYLPGMDYSELWESIAPVNTFRLIFNHYFGADYPLTKDY